MSRTYTNKLFELAENGVVSWESIAVSALRYMSEADVQDMAECEGFVDVEDAEEEDDGQPTEQEEWASFDPDC